MLLVKKKKKKGRGKKKKGKRKLCSHIIVFNIPCGKSLSLYNFAGAFILQLGFPSNSELHVGRLFRKYNKNVHKSDFGRVSGLYTFYSRTLLSGGQGSAATAVSGEDLLTEIGFYFFKGGSRGQTETALTR